MRGHGHRLPIVLNNLRSVRRCGRTDYANAGAFLSLWKQSGLMPRDTRSMHSLLHIWSQLPFSYAGEREPEALRRNLHLPRATRSSDPYMAQEPRIALFVDSSEHVSGVATTISEWNREARKQDLSLTVVTCGNEQSGNGLVSFPVLGRMRLGCYEEMDMPVPCVEDLVLWLDLQAFDAFHISTPGPVGMLALLYAHKHGIPVYGTYHTDFPGYARRLTGNPVLEKAAWSLMHWFYGAMRKVACPSDATLQELVRAGFPGEQLQVVGRGIRTDEFHPGLRDTTWHQRWGTEGKTHLLYVGRVSEEKNLACLADAYRMLVSQRDDVVLVVVGDGPYLPALQSELKDVPTVFTGLQRGRNLRSIYASCDLFVFPSETDTFGVVLLEAQASGLPVIVAGEGGPRHCMINNVTGQIVEPMTASALADVLQILMDNLQHLARMKRAARKHAARMTPEASFNSFWALHNVSHDSMPSGTPEAIAR